MSKADDGVPEQQIGQVAQLEAERANAVAYGNETRVAGIDKQLTELGVKKKAAAKRAESAEEPEARKSAPEGRSAVPPQKQTTAKKAASDK